MSPGARRVRVLIVSLQEFKTGEIRTIERPHDFPESHLVAKHFEPMVLSSIVTPNVGEGFVPDSQSVKVAVHLLAQSTYGAVVKLLQDRRGEQVDVVYMESDRVMMKYLLPWQEIVTDFYDKLKSITSGEGLVSAALRIDFMEDCRRLRVV